MPEQAAEVEERFSHQISRELSTRCASRDSAQAECSFIAVVLFFALAIYAAETCSSPWSSGHYLLCVLVV